MFFLRQYCEDDGVLQVSSVWLVGCFGFGIFIVCFGVEWSCGGGDIVAWYY